MREGTNVTASSDQTAPSTGTPTPVTPAAPAAPIDPGELIRSRGYVALLVLAGVVGVIVSIAGWVFLEVVVGIQHWVYRDLPAALGFATAPTWWPLPIVTLAGLPVAFAVARLPGRGGHRPAGGLGGKPAEPIDLPGVLLAAVAGIGLGVVLGPEAPLIALGGGLGLLTIRSVRRGAPNQAQTVIAAAGTFAAISTIFGNPVIGAVIIIEAAGLGGATLPLVLLPGLMAAGIGSVVFLGLGTVSGLSSEAYALGPLGLPPSPDLTVAEFGWTIALAVVAAIVGRIVIEVAWRVEHAAMPRPFLGIPAAGLAIAILAVVFAVVTNQPFELVLFSGQESMAPLIGSATTLSSATLALLFVCKGLAWAISLGGFRGGPIFPSMFIGLVGGLTLSALVGIPETPAAAVGIAAMTVSITRLPLSAVILTMVVTQAGLESTPLIIVSVVVAYIITELMHARRGTELPSGTATAAATAAT